jgi:membrane protein implicated in regulation of membrane protease activity
MEGFQEVAHRPTHCNISVTQTADSFDMYQPPFGFHPSMILLLGFAIFWNGFIFVWTMMAARAPFPANVPFALFSIPFWIIGLLLIYTVLFCFYGQTYLHIDRQTAIYSQKLFGHAMNKPKIILTHKIHSLILIRKHWYRGSGGHRQERPAEIRIEGSGQKISIGGSGGGIGDPETIDWLGYEISQWLNLPLKVVE